MDASKYLFWTVLMVGVMVIFILLVAPHFDIYLTYH